jgi:probable phosphoglycerate mutase
VTRPSIWLVRHAATAWTGDRYCGRSDPPLSGEGLAAAQALAAHLARSLDRSSAVWSSPALRALATASAIVAAAGAQPPCADERLREVDFGAAEGLSWPELEAAHPEVAAAVLREEPVDWPDGERDRAFRERAHAAWRDLTASTEGHGSGAAPAVVVAHGGVLAVFLGLLDDAAPAAPIAPAAAVGLASTEGAWRIVATHPADPEPAVP